MIVFTKDLLWCCIILSPVDLCFDVVEWICRLFGGRWDCYPCVPCLCRDGNSNGVHLFRTGPPSVAPTEVRRVISGRKRSSTSCCLPQHPRHHQDRSGTLHSVVVLDDLELIIKGIRVNLSICWWLWTWIVTVNVTEWLRLFLISLFRQFIDDEVWTRCLHWVLSLALLRVVLQSVFHVCKSSFTFPSRSFLSSMSSLCTQIHIAELWWQMFGTVLLFCLSRETITDFDSVYVCVWLSVSVC